MTEKLFRVLALDGGGAKGFYTLGVLKEIEELLGCKICDRFDLIYGTSTGAIIASLLALGYSVDEIAGLYRSHVVTIMAKFFPWSKSRALRTLSDEVLADRKVSDLKTRIGIVSTNWNEERPFIFKADVAQTFGRKESFVPFFGVTLGEAVQASCSAYPFFLRKVVQMSDGARVELVDGGFCANNPTLYALADTINAMNTPRASVRLVSIGVGEYPPPARSVFSIMRWIKYLITVRLLQKTLEINTQSMSQLRELLFKDIETVRINCKYTQPEMAADIFEHDLRKLDLLWRRGRDSFGLYEADLRKFFK